MYLLLLYRFTDEPTSLNDSPRRVIGLRCRFPNTCSTLPNNPKELELLHLLSVTPNLKNKTLIQTVLKYMGWFKSIPRAFHLDNATCYHLYIGQLLFCRMYKGIQTPPSISQARVSDRGFEKMLSFLEIYRADFEIGCLQIESFCGFSAT